MRRTILALSLLCATGCYPYFERERVLDPARTTCSSALPPVVRSTLLLEGDRPGAFTPQRIGTIETPNGTTIPWVAWTSANDTLVLTFDYDFPSSVEQAVVNQFGARMRFGKSDRVLTSIWTGRRSWPGCRRTISCTSDSILTDLTPALERLKALPFVRTVTVSPLPTEPCQAARTTRTTWQLEWLFTTGV